MTFESGLTKSSDFPVAKIHLDSSDINFKDYGSAFHAVPGANAEYESKGYLNTLRLEDSGRDVGQYQAGDGRPGQQVAYKGDYHNRREHHKNSGHHKGGGGQTDTAESGKDEGQTDGDVAQNNYFDGDIGQDNAATADAGQYSSIAEDTSQSDPAPDTTGLVANKNRSGDRDTSDWWDKHGEQVAVAADLLNPTPGGVGDLLGRSVVYGLEDVWNKITS